MKTDEIIVSESERIYTFHNDTGDAKMHVHNVFKGIELIYNSVHMDGQNLELPTDEQFIEIQHCREGRMEQQLQNEFFYLMPGDLSIVIRDQASTGINFPLKHYHGITIKINTVLAPKCFSCFLEDVNVNPLNVAKRLCEDSNYFVIRKEKYIEHIFAELYSVPENYRKGYFKIKILELLLVLSGVDPEKKKMDSISLSKTQVSLAKTISKYLADRTDSEITVSELAYKFNISKSHLQKAFNGVYGTSVFSYMRILKMHSAAMKLIQTEKSVMEIAGELGYDNASKFASAFREIMGETPTEYRKSHSIT